MTRASWCCIGGTFAMLLCQAGMATEAPKSSTPPALRDPKVKHSATSAGSGMHPHATVSNGPPPLGAILDLNGTPVPHASFQAYTVNFTATVPNTAVTFAIREDPAYIFIENITVNDMTVPGPNLLVNGNLTGGVYNSSGNALTPVGWTYANIYGASAGGVVDTPCGLSGGPGTSCWDDGAVDAYDALSQTITTTVGHTYQISFYLRDNSSQATFSRIDAGGLQGINLAVYAQAGLPTAGGGDPVPALSNAGLVLMAMILLAAGLVQLRRGAAARS
jgi:hypothetical protein